ncbi:MAG: putative amino-acid transrane transporter protein [Ramlibacter sp.]|nr:putative amino-acid transrane transporter protein [Ramlibacter sp.]
MAIGYWEHVATLGCINALLALGFYVTFLTGQFSAAHAAFMGVGAYAAGLLSARSGVPYPLAVLAGGAAAALVAGLAVSALRRLNGMILAIATLALAEILIVVLKNSRTLGGALGLSGVGLKVSLWQVALVLVVAVLAMLRFENSRYGVAFRAIRDDPRAAAASSMNVMNLRILSFAMGGFLCGLAGGLQVHYLGVIEPDELGFYMTVAMLLFVVIGGRDYFLGPVIAALVFTALPELLRVTSRERLVIFSLILVVVVIARPRGLMPRPVFWKRNIRAASTPAEPPASTAAAPAAAGKAKP